MKNLYFKICVSLIIQLLAAEDSKGIFLIHIFFLFKMLFFFSGLSAKKKVLDFLCVLRLMVPTMCIYISEGFVNALCFVNPHCIEQQGAVIQLQTRSLVMNALGLCLGAEWGPTFYNNQAVMLSPGCDIRIDCDSTELCF